MTLPVMLNVQNRSVVCVGGGEVAVRKVRSFVKEGAHMTVVSPSLHEQLRPYADNGQIVWKKKKFQPIDLADAWFVLACTNDRALNEQVAIIANKNKQLCYVADDPQSSDVTFPVVKHKGAITVALSTGGASPTLARTLLEEIVSHMPDDMDEILVFLAEARVKVKQRIADESVRRELLKKLATSAVYHQSDRYVWLEEQIKTYTDTFGGNDKQ